MIALLFVISRVTGNSAVLPPLNDIDGVLNQPGHLPSFAKVFVREFRFDGNTVFTDEELAILLRPFANRELDSADLEEARLLLTQHYISSGFLTSGAVLESQPVHAGIITFRILEGALTQIQITGNRRLRLQPLRTEIQLGVGHPLKLSKLQDTLWLLKQNPNIKSLDAELRPGPTRGESRLELQVREENPWRLTLNARNDRPPAVGAEIIDWLVEHQNLTGRSDTLSLQLGLAEADGSGFRFSGLDPIGTAYHIPVARAHGTAFAGFDRSDYAIVEEPFEDLDITSASQSIRAGWRQRLFRTPAREFALTLMAEWRESQSFLDRQPFSFSPGAVRGTSSSTAIRFSQEFTHRSLDRLYALRSTLNWGIDLFGPTDNGTDRDGTFVSWLGQAQLVRRLGTSPNQFVVATTAQWTESPLLGVEQFTLGGAHTIRGYRENSIVRDMGISATTEFRLPMLFNKSGGALIELAPFSDYGIAWDRNGRESKQLLSTGIGLRFHGKRHFSGQVYWGYGWLERERRTDRNLQDYGVHFRIGLRLL